MRTLNSLSILSAAAALASDAAAAQPAESKEVKKLTVADDMDSRRVFDSTEDAANYLNHCADTYSDFATTPLAAAGLDAEGDFDPNVYTGDMRVMVATLRNTAGPAKGIKAIVVAPIPTLDAVLADPEARKWLDEKVLCKELNHVAVRPLRTAEDVTTVMDQMPTTLAAYYSSARESAGIMESFNTLYKDINDTMSKKVGVWNKAKLTKADLRKSFESKGYAEEYYPALENRGDGKPSLFVLALQLAIGAAKLKGLDPTIFERWQESRDAKKFTGAEEDDADSLDIDALSQALAAKPTTTEGEKPGATEPPAADQQPEAESEQQPQA